MARSMVLGCPRAPPECAYDPALNASLCACPPGCSGFDEWQFYPESCHVNVKLALVVQVLAAVACAAVIVTALIALVAVNRVEHSPGQRLSVFLRRVCACCVACGGDGAGVFSTGDSSTVSAGVSDAVGGGAVSAAAASPPASPTAPSRASARRGAGSSLAEQRGSVARTRIGKKHVTHQTILSAWVIVNFLTFGVAFLAYNLMLLAGLRRYMLDEPAHFVMDLSVCVGSIACLLALWGISDKWYDSLPNLRRYGKLLRIGDKWLVRHPSFFRSWTRLWSAITVLTLGLFFLVLPSARRGRSDEDLVIARAFCDRSALLSMAVIVAVWMFSMLAVTELLERVFKVVSEQLARMPGGGAPGEPAPPERGSTAGAAILQEFAKVRETFKAVRILVLVGSSLAIATMLATALIPLLSSSMYITLSVITCTGAGTAVVMLYLVIFRAGFTAKELKSLLKCGKLDDCGCCC